MAFDQNSISGVQGYKTVHTSVKYVFKGGMSSSIPPTQRTFCYRTSLKVLIKNLEPLKEMKLMKLNLESYLVSNLDALKNLITLTELILIYNKIKGQIQVHSKNSHNQHLFNLSTTELNTQMLQVIQKVQQN
ncbi:Hypothetical_protein [Hexamita inflata]|uniref:Hypothetical_protein n=1 Tax=Hexamita inflata TaxID=28002 RepID=A0ABP1J580_9EUKA